MSKVKTKHMGGDSKARPTSGATHKEQVPGYSCEHPTGMMSWSGHEQMHKEHRHKYTK